MTSILITRPRIAAEPLAIELKQLGYKTVIEPLLSINLLNTPHPHNVSFDAVIITSGNVLPALESRRQDIGSFSGLPCFCVGPRTAEKVSGFGFRHVQSSGKDGTELARFTGQVLARKNASILHIAGTDTDNRAQRELEKQGHHVTVWPVYEAVPVAAFTPGTQNLFEKQQLDAIVVFSPRTAERLVQLLANSALKACCTRLAAICLSETIAGVLRPLSWRHLAAAPVPTESAVIACLQEICPVQL